MKKPASINFGAGDAGKLNYAYMIWQILLRVRLVNGDVILCCCRSCRAAAPPHLDSPHNVMA
jgi:hypothetical protein